jgi:hypothetical protein
MLTEWALAADSVGAGASELFEPLPTSAYNPPNATNWIRRVLSGCRVSANWAKPIPQFCFKPLGIGLVFKAGDDVIGIAHQDHVPQGMVAPPPLSQRSAADVDWRVTNC